MSSPRVASKVLGVMIRASDGNTNFNENVSVLIAMDEEVNEYKIFIRADNQIRFYKGLRDFQWAQESSTDGVAAINSSTHTLIILYDQTDQEQTRLIAALEAKVSNKQNVNTEKLLTNSFSNKSLNHSTIQENYSTTDLIDSINRGDVANAEKIASELAKRRTAAHLFVSEKEQDGKNEYIRLNVVIESDLDQPQIRTSMSIPTHKTLDWLKQEIERKTHIERENQHWLAFGRHLINDNYVFGSKDPVYVMPIDGKGNRSNHLRSFIVSGDTLILYIARSRRLKI